MRCALYARVSTAKDRGLQNPETQLRQLREFANSQGWDLAGEYIDRESGAEANRKQFAAMMAAASKRQFDMLLFWSLDRFGRGGIVPTLTDLKRLDGYGVRYRSYQEAYIDTASPFGDLLTAFVAKIAELERKRIIERINATATISIEERIMDPLIGGIVPRYFHSPRQSIESNKAAPQPETTARTDSTTQGKALKYCLTPAILSHGER
jgi:hypothetical protein